MSLVIESLTLAAEFAIAFVIYYEIEENRAATFLAEGYGTVYSDRAGLYDTFVEMPGTTAKEKAAKFAEFLASHSEDRKKSDAQLVYFARFHYMFQRSLFHRKLMVQWFPQVYAKLWMILQMYYVKKPLMPKTWNIAFTRAVIAGLTALEKEGQTEVTIYGKDANVRIAAPITELKASAQAALSGANVSVRA